MIDTLKIGVDASCWRNTRGYGRHLRALLKALLDVDAKNEYTLVVDAPDCTNELPDSAKSMLVPSSVPAASAASAAGRRSLGDMWRMSRALSSGAFDVLLFPTVYTFVPVVSRARKIVVIHDVIAERFPQLTFSNPVARTLWQAKVALGRWQADAIVTVSEYSKRGIVDHFGIAPNQVHVVSEASDPIFRVLDNHSENDELARAGIPESGRLLVYVGGFGPHKNLETLAESFARARRRGHEDVLLVFVGEYRKEVFFSTFESLSQRIDALGIRSHVVFTGYLSDEALVALLNRATALVLPSLIEGFGLPAVEAAACGCPVVATTESPIPELLEEGGIYFDPSDPRALEQALVEMLDPATDRAALRAGALEAASRLTWSDAAAQMLGVIEEVASG